MSLDFELAPVRAIAEKEFWDRIRNRWVLAIAALFAAVRAGDCVSRRGATGRGRISRHRCDHRKPREPRHLSGAADRLAPRLRRHRRRARQRLARAAAVDADYAPRTAARKVRGAGRGARLFHVGRISGWRACCSPTSRTGGAVSVRGFFRCSAFAARMGVPEHRRAGIGRGCRPRARQWRRHRCCGSSMC